MFNKIKNLFIKSKIFTKPIKPSTLDEAINQLDIDLSPEDKDALLNTSKDRLVIWHHTLGRWIRNNYGLWQDSPLKGYMLNLGFIHSDDMSSSIIAEYWNRKHNKPSEIQQDIQYYKEFWSKNES